jgi:hypothetical protein
MYTMTSNGVEVGMDAQDIAAAKIEAEAWASYGAGVTIWEAGQPVCELPFTEGSLIGDGNGSRTFSHGPWQDC